MNPLSRRGGYIIEFPLNSGINKSNLSESKPKGYILDAVNLDITERSLKRRKGYKSWDIGFNEIKGLFPCPGFKKIYCVADNNVYEVRRDSKIKLHGIKRYDSQLTEGTNLLPVFNSTNWGHSTNSAGTNVLVRYDDTTFGKIVIDENAQLIVGNSFEESNWADYWDGFLWYHFAPPTSVGRVAGGHNGSYCWGIRNGTWIQYRIIPRENQNQPKLTVPYFTSYPEYQYSRIGNPMFCDFYYKVDATRISKATLEFNILAVIEPGHLGWDDAGVRYTVWSKTINLNNPSTGWILVRAEFTPRQSDIRYEPYIKLNYDYLNGWIYLDYFYQKSCPNLDCRYTTLDYTSLPAQSENFIDYKLSVDINASIPVSNSVVLKGIIDFYDSNHNYLSTMTPINNVKISTGSKTYSVTGIHPPKNAVYCKVGFYLSGNIKDYQDQNKNIIISNPTLKMRTWNLYEQEAKLILNSDRYEGINFFDYFYLVGENDIWKIQNEIIGQYNYLGGAKHVCLHKDRLWFSGTTEDPHPSSILFTNPNILGQPPDYLPEANVIMVDPDSGGEITGLCSMKDRLVIFKTTGIYGILGDSETNFYLQKMFDIGADNHDTIVQYENMVFFTNGDKIYLLTPGGLRELTEIMDVKLSEKSRAYVIEDKYIIRGLTETYVFNIKFNAWTKYDKFNFNGAIRYYGKFIMFDKGSIYDFGYNDDDGEVIDASLTLGIIPEVQRMSESRVRKFSFEYTPFICQTYNIKFLQEDVASTPETYTVREIDNKYARFVETTESEGSRFDSAYFCGYPSKSNVVLVPQAGISRGDIIEIGIDSDPAYSDKEFELLSASVLKRERRVGHGNN